MVRMSTKNKPPPPVLHVEAVIPMFDASNSPRAAANDIETRKDTSCQLRHTTTTTISLDNMTNMLVQ